MKNIIISNDLKKELINQNINPLDIIKIHSKYDKINNIIITEITLNDNTKCTIKNETAWYAARKNKRW
jgi:hypothetical protein